MPSPTLELLTSLKKNVDCYLAGLVRWLPGRVLDLLDDFPHFLRHPSLSLQLLLEILQLLPFSLSVANCKEHAYLIATVQVHIKSKNMIINVNVMFHCKKHHQRQY